MGLFKRGTLLYTHEKPFGQILNFPYKLFPLSIAMQVPCAQTAVGRATAPGFSFHQPRANCRASLFQNNPTHLSRKNFKRKKIAIPLAKCGKICYTK